MAGNPRQGDVAIEHQAHLRRAEEEVVAAVVGDQEAEAIAMAGDASAHQVQLVDGGIGATAGIDHLTIALHGTHAAPQGFELVLGDEAEFLGQLRPCGRSAAIGEMSQNEFATRNGVIVLFRFPGGLGIEGLPIGHQSGVTF